MLDTTINDIPTRSATGLLMLNAIKGVGRAAITKLVDRFDTIGECLRADDESLKACLNVKQRSAFRDPKIIDTAYRQAFKEILRAEEINALIISLYDDNYPERLRLLDEPPFVLYAAGDLSVLEKSVGFVGTREPTDFGAKVAYGMASAFASEGFCIVSGLARGVDSISHRAAVEAGGNTCAVLASGLDRYSSGAALELAQRICEGGGLLITECGFGQDPTQGSYIDRDRLITGLSLGTVFVQGEAMSGSMHSVRYALVQDKPIYVPNIPEKFLAEDINHTARNLSRLTTAQFASQCDWKGSVMEAVARRADMPIADAILNRDDYPRVFGELNALVPTASSRPVSYADIGSTF